MANQDDGGKKDDQENVEVITVISEGEIENKSDVDIESCQKVTEANTNEQGPSLPKNDYVLEPDSEIQPSLGIVQKIIEFLLFL